MMRLIIILQIIALNSLSQCDITASLPFPSTLVLNQGDTLCVTSTIEVASTTTQVNNGGVIKVMNGSTLKITGSIAINPGGRAIFDCTSKIEVKGTYTGNYGVDEMKRYCLCSSSTTPLTLITGVKQWDGWECLTPLPIELVRFEGKKIMKGRNSIKWTTASQIMNDYFEVEKSYDGKEWLPIIRIEGNNGSSLLTYGINDLEKKNAYYRLRQVDFDGAFSVSKVISIRGDDCRVRRIIRRVNMLGQSVKEDDEGVKIIIYNDNTVEYKTK